jgi:hypothetical protein
MKSEELPWWSVVPVSVLTDALSVTTWALADGTVGSDPYLLRFREPLPAASARHGHSIRFSVLWSYGDKGAFPPSPQEDAKMDRFEQHLCRAIERDGLAFLMAALTFGGSRHWVFYTSDGYACGTRIAQMPHDSEPYPIEMVAENDPDWSFFRSGIFGASAPRTSRIRGSNN